MDRIMASLPFARTRIITTVSDFESIEKMSYQTSIESRLDPDKLTTDDKTRKLPIAQSEKYTWANARRAWPQTTALDHSRVNDVHYKRPLVHNHRVHALRLTLSVTLLRKNACVNEDMQREHMSLWNSALRAA